MHLYIVVFLVSRIFGIINRVLQLAIPCCPVFAIWFLQELFTTMQGMGNAFVYGLNYTIRTIYRVKICSRKRKAQSPSTMQRSRASTLASRGHRMSVAMVRNLVSLQCHNITE